MNNWAANATAKKHEARSVLSYDYMKVHYMRCIRWFFFVLPPIIMADSWDLQPSRAYLVKSLAGFFLLFLEYILNEFEKFATNKWILDAIMLINANVCLLLSVFSSFFEYSIHGTNENKIYKQLKIAKEFEQSFQMFFFFQFGNEISALEKYLEGVRTIIE